MKTSIAILSLALLSSLLVLVAAAPSGAASDQQAPCASEHAQWEGRSHCQTHSGCDFYSHCVETAFHCGSGGFAISYAKQRCKIIKKLRPVGNTEYSVSREAKNWARDTETCLHAKLIALLAQYPDPHPDPMTCLDWEAKAIAGLSECYSEEQEAFLQLPEADIRKLVDLFRIGSDYYSPIVDASLVELIKTGNAPLASDIVRNHTLSARHRIVLCVKGTKYVNEDDFEPTAEDYLRAVSSRLAPEEFDYFHYAGPDFDSDGELLCYDRSIKLNINAARNDYHLVTWFTTEHSQKDIRRTEISFEPGQKIQVNVVMFELTTSAANNMHTQRVVTQCGDGIRQLSEQCDFTHSYPSCTVDCQVRAGHDCSAGKLAASQCWKEECGDGLRTRGEECDDGNDEDGDGCNSTCSTENTHVCSNVYNSTSKCTPKCTPKPALSQLPEAPPARLLSQTAPSVNLAAAQSPTEGRTELSSGYRSSATILPIILGMVGALNLR